MKLGKFIAGLGLGAAAGMLLAPKKGEELRSELKEKSNELYGKAKSMSKEDYQEMLKDLIDDMKKTIDEFDGDEFKESSMDKLVELKDRVEELYTSMQSSEEYSKVKDAIKKVSDDVTDKMTEVKTKIQDKDSTAIENLEEGIDEIEEEISVILDDLKD
ncbi:YtxH domain-containing protein [Tannockella kyphosi]|uniref:YtxH domain-containing protein n=1 Tax=Tannockella kyphosi TaxID=2899121 RepID=UPI002010DAA7|nr:YtxH domain-containing protein [Tannockella kyphosi]